MPDVERRLQLPRERQRWQAATDAYGSLDLVEVRAFTESLGRVEEAVACLASRLRAGGTLLFDVDNLQSARMLRLVVEGRPGQFDPSGSTQDPSQALPLRRVLHALAAADLCVRDVLAVASGAEEFADDLPQRLFGTGLLPLDWLQGAPPSRYWLVAEKAEALAGSALIAGGDDAARARTEAALREILPDDWEIVVGDAVGECAQWNRAISAARGDVVWFLRAGTTPTAADFELLSARASVGAVAPGAAGERLAPGDVAGTMMPRLDVLFVGPLPELIPNTRVALEEYSMRLDTRLPQAWLVETSFSVPEAIVEHPETFARDAAELLERWSVVGVGDEAPGSASPASSIASGSNASGSNASASNVSPSDFRVTTAPRTRREPPTPPWEGRKPRITLCMIARDEERFLATCLEHARAAFDELVVVDTGSTDRTVEIAEAFGAKVLHDPWHDDFSAPRNVGLAAANGDWILVLDADEFVQPGSCERIRELVESPTALGFHMRFVNDYGDGKTVGVMMVRLFRNLPGVVYENVIHEQVTPSLQRVGGPLGLILASSDVEVVHHGYSDELMQSRSKNERNERLFQKQLAAAPEDVYSHYKYGDFLRRVPGRSEDARRMLERCLELILAASPTLPRSLPYAGEVAALCALEAERAGDRPRAREVVDLALRRFVPTPNLHYIAASLALVDNDAPTAIQHYRRCLSYRDQVLVVPIQEGITSYVSLAGIAQAWLLRGDRVRAQRLLEQAIAIEPRYEVAHLALSRLSIERGDISRALQILTDYLACCPDSPGACQQTMLILQRIGRTDAAREMGHHTVRLLQARALDREAAVVRNLLAKL